MKFDGKEIKDMTKEEIKDYLDFVESNPVTKWYVESFYGNVDKFKNEVMNKWKEKDKIQSNSNLNMEQKIIKDTVKQVKRDDIINNSNTVTQEKIKNNINKKCRIINHPYLKDNTKGVIKDKVDLTQQYVVVINDKDIVYIDKDNVRIIEDGWEDISLKGYCEELDANYSIVIKEDLNTIVNIWSDNMFQEYHKKYNCKLLELKPFIDNHKENKNNILNYILGKIKIKQYKKQSEDIDTQLNNLQKQQNQIQDKINKEEIKVKDIIGKKVNNLEQ